MTTNAMQMTPTGGPGLHLNLGEKVPIKQSTLTVTETDVAVLPRLRDYLMGVARARGTVTYTEVKVDLELPHAVNGLGRLLDLLSVECVDRRGEPSLAALVVAQDTGEVGADFEGDPVATRDEVYAHWG